MPPAEVHDAYLRADRLLKGTRDAEEVARLRAGALVVMRRLSGTPVHEKEFSLYGAVHEFEAKLIGQALEDSGGSVAKAARLLGVNHQTLSAMLDGRHERLRQRRTPPQKRLKSIIKKPKDKPPKIKNPAQ